MSGETGDHHEDCDGYRISHPCQVATIATKGRGLFQAQCLECEWLGPLTGEHDTSRKAAMRHEQGWTECDRRCLRWDDETEEVDGTGQKSPEAGCVSERTHVELPT